MPAKWQSKAAPNASLPPETPKTSRNHQNQLCQNSEKQSKVYGNLANNQEKSNFKRVHVFIGSCPLPPLLLVNPEDGG